MMIEAILWLDFLAEASSQRSGNCSIILMQDATPLFELSHQCVSTKRDPILRPLSTPTLPNHLNDWLLIPLRLVSK